MHGNELNRINSIFTAGYSSRLLTTNLYASILRTSFHQSSAKSLRT
jgi:hypothetical protein